MSEFTVIENVILGMECGARGRLSVSAQWEACIH